MQSCYNLISQKLLRVSDHEYPSIYGITVNHQSGLYNDCSSYTAVEAFLW